MNLHVIVTSPASEGVWKDRMYRYLSCLVPVLIALFLAGCAGPDVPPAPVETANTPAANSPAASGELPNVGLNVPASNAPAAGDAGKTSGKPVNVEMVTSMGTINLELYPDKAPVTVENFVDYAKKGHFNGTIFHRVISDFMVQGGGFTPDMNEKETGAGIQNEAGNGLSNTRGTIAMARTGDPNSATAQFFINTVDNFKLDRGAEPGGFGYAVFGKVTKGMDVVDKIRAVKTTTRGPHENVPVNPVTIKSVKVK